MNKFLKILAGICSLFPVICAMADLEQSPPQQVTTVSQVKAKVSAVRVTLIGKIVKQIKDDKYEFQDSSGTIIVKIGPKEWKSVSIDSNTTVKITADLEKGFFTDNTLELVVVKTIEIIQETSSEQTSKKTIKE